MTDPSPEETVTKKIAPKVVEEHLNEDGKRHREGAPAVTYEDGTIEFYINGKLHRDGQPAVINKDGQEWYQNGKIHRTDGPAYEYGNLISYYYEGALHRLDGPATIITKDDKTHELWLVNGTRTTQEEVEKLVDWLADRDMVFSELDDFDKEVLKIEYPEFFCNII